MSKEYIEKERALHLLEENASDDEVFFAARAIEAEPPADVKPVVRGEWLDGRCTNCAWELPDYEYYGGSEIGNVSCDEFKFCPNCGAKMKEANDER